MYDGSDVRFIDAHPECNCGHYALQLISQEPVVSGLSLDGRQACMVALTLHSSICTMVDQQGNWVKQLSNRASPFKMGNCQLIVRVAEYTAVFKMTLTFK